VPAKGRSDIRQTDEDQTDVAQGQEQVQPETQFDIATIKKNIIAGLKKANEPFLSSALERTGEWSLQDGKVTIPCSDSFQAVKVEDASKKIESLIGDMTGKSVVVEVLKPKKKAADQGAEEVQVSASVELVKKVFKGEIV
jgi:hypothetical protein